MSRSWDASCRRPVPWFNTRPESRGLPGRVSNCFVEGQALHSCTVDRITIGPVIVFVMGSFSAVMRISNMPCQIILLRRNRAVNQAKSVGR
jgi:hypothetical protein